MTRSPSDPDSSPFRRVKTERLPDLVAEQLLERITGEGLMPGHRLPTEHELGAQFGVSRTVVREAIRSLAARGVVEARTGSGLVVAAVPADTVRESLALYLRAQPDEPRPSFEARMLLEVEVARLAARRSDAAALLEIATAHRAFASAVRNQAPDVAQLVITDMAFHRAIARSAGNQLYELLLEAIATAHVDVRRARVAVREEREAAVVHHGALLDCLAEHDERGAAEAMEAHLAAIIAGPPRRTAPSVLP